MPFMPFRSSMRILFLLPLLLACKNTTDPVACNPNLINRSLTYTELLAALPAYAIEGLTKAPDAEGALGRNKNGYFHVRFQMDIGYLATHAVRFENETTLAYFLQAVTYSFQHQLPAGDFELVIPTELISLGPPTEGDLTSGIAFFLSALGPALVSLQQSTWFLQRTDPAVNQKLATLQPQFIATLNYMKTKAEVLQAYDATAPNRLLFDAVAFYSMGLYLNDAEAKAIGLDFMQRAIAMQHESGYFIEGDGFDSSYNGVALRLGFSLLALLPPTDSTTSALAKCLACAVRWQTSRVTSAGEILLDGNTRVYPGGEEFLGVEKQVAWVDTLMSLYFAYALSGDDGFIRIAEAVEDYYA
jgi:hypothetical protein